MAQRTVVNDLYRGLVDNVSIPVKLHERDGKKFASCAGVVPIHCCTPDEVAVRSKTTHHYADIFADEALAPLEDMAYVRLDDSHAERVVINRTRRILVLSADGYQAQWRETPTFESDNTFIAGTPIVNKKGALMSVVTAKRGKHYAVSGIQGPGGYFDTKKQWKILTTLDRGYIYGEKSYKTLEELQNYQANLPPLVEGIPTPVLHKGANQITLVSENGRQICHIHLQGVVSYHTVVSV